MRKNNNQTRKNIVTYVLVALIVAVCGYWGIDLSNFGGDISNTPSTVNEVTIDFAELPEYDGEIYIELNGNIPEFSDVQYSDTFENYSELDQLGRCGVAFALVGKEIMPPEGDEREGISSVKPTGWRSGKSKYTGQSVYNRCHLIARSLAGEDANKLNLITGTDYFNHKGMLPFERKVLNYLKSNQNNHVLYRVTPYFEGDNLVATGVQMEAYSVEDNGEGICFNVFVYNVQDGVTINYETGEWSE